MSRSRRARNGATTLRTITRSPGSRCIGESWQRRRSWTRASWRCSKSRTALSNLKRSKRRALSWARRSSIPTTSCSATIPFTRASLRSTEAKEKSRKSASASARKVASSRGKTQNPARVRRPMIQNTQIVYAKPPADGALPDPAGTFNVVHTPFDTEAVNLKAGEVLVENHYLSIDPYHRFGLYDPAVTRSQFPATKPGTIISTYGISRVLRSANPKSAEGEGRYRSCPLSRPSRRARPDRICRDHSNRKTQGGRDHRRLRNDGCGWHGRVAAGEATGPDRGRHGGLRREGALPGR